MYNKRILEKEIKEYIKTKTGGIRYRDIDKLGRKHGFYVT
jgi:hypothetical protein